MEKTILHRGNTLNNLQNELANNIARIQKCCDTSGSNDKEHILASLKKVSKEPAQIGENHLAKLKDGLQEKKEKAQSSQTLCNIAYEYALLNLWKESEETMARAYRFSIMPSCDLFLSGTNRKINELLDKSFSELSLNAAKIGFMNLARRAATFILNEDILLNTLIQFKVAYIDFVFWLNCMKDRDFLSELNNIIYNSKE